MVCADTSIDVKFSNILLMPYLATSNFRRRDRTL